MEIYYYKFEDSNNLESIDSEKLAIDISGQDLNYLIEIVDASSKDIQVILDRFEFNPSIINNCLEFDSSSLSEIYSRQFYIRFPVVNLKRDIIESLNIIFLWINNIMIIVREKESSDITKIIKEIIKDEEVEDKISMPRLLVEIFAFLVKEESNVFWRLKQKTNKLTNKSLDLPEPMAIREMMNLKRQVEDLLNIVEDQLMCTNSLKKVVGHRNDKKEILEFIYDLTKDFERALIIISRLNKRLSDHQNYFQITINEKTNSRLRLLTIISSIFLPITLIAGIFGMNFDYMPGVHWKYGYQATIFLMIGISVLLILIFYNKGWFK